VRRERLHNRWPILSTHLQAALIAKGETALAATVESLQIVECCGCGDDFCQSFYVRQKPDGPFGAGHRNVMLEPPWPGYLILDVVDDAIIYIEVLYRQTLD
jgi:hypothetical protein